MKHKAFYLLYCKLNLHFSGVNHNHHRQFTKLTTAAGTDHNFSAATCIQSCKADE